MKKLKAFMDRTVSSLGKKRAVLILVLIVVVVGGAAAVYYNKYKLSTGADTVPSNVITNVATLSYTDSQQQQKTVTSNVVMTNIQNTPDQTSYTFPAGKGGWNLFALSKKPANPDPAVVFSTFESSEGQTGEYGIDGVMYRWDNQVGGICVYDMLSEPGGCFGNLETGYGYWVITEEQNYGKTITYDIATDENPKIIGPLRAGWAILGNPFETPINVDNIDVNKIFFTRGTEEKTWSQAFTDGWIDGVAFVWDPIAGGLVDVGSSDAWTSSQTIGPNQGFWINFFQDNISVKYVAG